MELNLCQIGARQRGLTLIELMISITVGLVIVSALSYLYVGSRGTYRVNDNLARMQETGRFALDWISRDLRGIGFMGCLASREAELLVVARPPIPFSSGADAIKGIDRSSSSWTGTTSRPRVTGDALLIRSADSASVNLESINDVPGARITIANNCLGFRESDTILISDCEKGYVVRITNTPANTCTATGSSAVTLEHFAGATGNPGNGENGIVSGADSHKIGALAVNNGAKVYRVQEKGYYIANNPGGRRALYRWTSADGAEEVVENVEDLDVRYGLDTDNNDTVDEYRTAADVETAALWPQVRSARVSLLVVSPDDSVATQAQQFTFRDTSGDGVPDAQTAADRRLRQVFTATVALRNRLN